MKGDSILIWCYSVNLAYLITNLYGWLLKQVFKRVKGVSPSEYFRK